MVDFIQRTIEQWGYVGVFLLIAAENVFPPIPSEVILAFTGFMSAKSNLNLVGALIAATLGSLAGALILYCLGAKWGAKGAYAVVERHGKWLRIKKNHIDRAIEVYSKRAQSTVLLCRLVPILRSLISLPAGICKMPLGAFILLTTLGSLAWNAVLLLLGAFMGENWHNVVRIFKLYSWAFYALLALIALAIIIILLIKRHLKK